MVETASLVTLRRTSAELGVDLDGAAHVGPSPRIGLGWVVVAAFDPAVADDRVALRLGGAHKAAGVASRLAFLD